MARPDLSAVLAQCPGLIRSQLDRAGALARERPELDPRVLLHTLLAEDTLGPSDLNVALGAVLAKLDPEPHMADLSGRTLGPFRLLQRLGPLPGGASYLAEPLAGGPQVVLKLLPEGASRDASVRLASIAHPNLCPIRDSGAADGLSFLVLDLRPGTSLREAEFPRGPEGVARATEWAQQAARAVETLHRRGFAHGSLSPDDFIAAPDGSLALADLGVAALDPGGPLRKAFGQGAAFAAPEILAGRPPGPRSDLYSLGVLLHGLFARRPLFEGLTPGALFQRRLREKPSAEPLLRAGAPPAVAAALLPLLETDPERRPADLAPFAAALAASAAPPPPPPRPAPAPARAAPRPVTTRKTAPPPPPLRASSRLVVLAASMVLLAAAAVALAIAMIVKREPPPAPVAVAPPSLPIAETAPLPTPPGDRPKLLSQARAAERNEKLADAIRLYREAAALQSDSLLAEKIQTLETLLRDRTREEADADQVRKAVATLPPEAALVSVDEFLARWPKSRHAEDFLQTKRELVLRIRETAPPPPPEPPKPPAAEVPKATAAPPLPKKVPGVPGRAMDPSIRDALLWLARHQSDDGSWSVTNHVRRCSGRGCDPNPGIDEFGAGVTALSVLALLGAGIGWHDQDEYAGENLGETLRRGVAALVAMGGDGPIGGRRRQKYGYNHALGVHALSEAVRSAPDLRTSAEPGLVSLREAQASAVDFLLDAQNPGQGWRYSARCGDNDSSVTATAVLALESAKAAGSSVPAPAFQGAVRFFESVTDDTWGRAGYTHKGTGKVFVPGVNEHFHHHETLTAAAWGCRLRLGTTPPANARKGLELVLRDLPGSDPLHVDYYYWYHGTRLVKDAGDALQRTRWRDALVQALPSQRPRDPNGCSRGSYEPRDRWSGEGGRVYATAIVALTLEHLLLPKAFEYPRRVGLSPPAEAAEVRWIFLLKSGGQVRVVSYEEREGKYYLKLPAGQSVIEKDGVQQIQKAPAKEKP
jgi:hypothetical protein